MIKLHIILGICKEFEYQIEDNKLIERFKKLLDMSFNSIEPMLH
jgi:hypothetical protein